MKLDASVLVASLNTPGKQDQTATFPGGDSWAAKLTLGQILKGKVLRSYGEGRYSVDFGGQQRVVDSSVPLSVGDQLRGRVVGLSERVTIERLPDSHAPSPANKDSVSRPATSSLHGAEAVRYLAQQSNIPIGVSEAETVAGVAKNVPDPEVAIRAGLFLAKLGLPLSAELVRTLYERIMMTPSQFQGMSAAKLAPTVTAEHGRDAEADTDGADSTITTLARCLADDCNAEGCSTEGYDNAETEASTAQSGPLHGGATDSHPSEAGNGESSDSGRERQFAAMLAAMLNAQTGACLQHRFRTLPVLIDGRLREFDLALFDHAPRDIDGVHAKRLHFALATDHGPLDVIASAIDGHVRIAFSGKPSLLLDALETHSAELERGLRQHGWLIEGTAYRHMEAGSPARSIVDHVLAQDSLRMAL